MATYEVTSPDGRKFEVNAPDGATQDEVLAYAKTQFAAPSAPGQIPTNAAIDRAPAAIEKSDKMAQIGRQLGLTARSGINAVTALPAMMADAATGVVNQALPPGKRFQQAGPALNALLTQWGIPAPGNAAERVVGDMVSAAGGAGAMAGAARKAGGLLQPLAEKAGQQVAAAATGSAAGSITRENDGGVPAQMLASVLGSLAPTAAMTGWRGAFKNTTEAGRRDTKGRLLNDAAGKQRDDVLIGLDNNRSFVRGERPTAAQASADAGSPTFAGLEKLVAQRHKPELVDARSLENEAARLGAVRTVGKDAAALKTAIRQRTDEAEMNYDAAFAVKIKADPSLAVLSRNPYFKAALPDAMDMARARKITTKGDLTEFLHLVKLSLDDMMMPQAKTAMGKNKLGAVKEVKDELVTWLGNKNKAYDVARSMFAQASKPINQMQVGQYLENKLTSPLTAAERPGAFAQATRDATGTIKRSTTQGPRFEKLSDVLTPQQVDTIGGVQNSLAREARTSDLAALGTPKARSLIGETFSPLEPPPLLHRVITTARFLLEKVGVNTMNKTLAELARDMQDPAIAAKLMREANPTQRAAMLEVIKAASKPAMAGLMQPVAQIE